MKNKGGFVISGELVLIATVLVIGLLVGTVAVRDAVLAELNDTADAYGTLSQSYQYEGVVAHAEWANDYTEGTYFNDGADRGDASVYLTYRAMPSVE
jgi:hypothetical protein